MHVCYKQQNINLEDLESVLVLLKEISFLLETIRKVLNLQVPIAHWKPPPVLGAGPH